MAPVYSDSPARSPRASSRLSGLDGLRGVAALVVLIHHALLTVPELSKAYYLRDGPVEPYSAAWFFSYTPAHLVWAGQEAVSLFFVLSGLVLVRQVFQGRGFTWRTYFPRRLVRLYLPIVAAVLLGYLSIVLVTRTNDETFSAWLNARPNTFTAVHFFKDITVLGGTSGRISPMWSLRWEVIFSLTLPLYVIFGRLTRRLPFWIPLAVTFALTAWGSRSENDYLVFLPMFAVGAVLTVHWEQIGRLSESLTRRRWGWTAFLVVALLLTSILWPLQTLGLTRREAASHEWLTVVGVTMFVVAAGFCPGALRLLSRHVILWLGTVSFSLYLIHEPIVIAVSMLAADTSPWIGVLIAIPVSLGVAAAFHAVIERPAHQLARRIGRA